MKRILFVLAVSTVAGFVPPKSDASSERENTIAALGTISDNWAEANLRATVNGATTGNFRLGDKIQFGFDADRECFVTLFHVDGHGVGTVISVSDELGPLMPATSMSYPSKNIHLEVAPPLGRENLYAYCTGSKVDLSSVGAVGGVAVVEAHQAPEVARAFSSLMADQQVSVAALEYRVLGRTRSVEYSVDDVVQYFNTRTRSISRPVLPIHVNFKLNSAELTDEAKENLDVIGEAFNNSSLQTAVFEIGGHTDATGTEQYNLSLSEQRAASAKAYLEAAHGISPDRLEVHPYGESEPRESNDTEEGRAFNRRVEFKFLP